MRNRDFKAARFNGSLAEISTFYDLRLRVKPGDITVQADNAGLFGVNESGACQQSDRDFGLL